MTITEKSFILVQGNAGTFLVNGNLEDALRKEMRPILWFRAGLFSVVPVEVLQNALELTTMYSKAVGKVVTIHWSETFPFPDGRAATILAGLEY